MGSWWNTLWTLVIGLSGYPYRRRRRQLSTRTVQYRSDSVVPSHPTEQNVLAKPLESVQQVLSRGFIAMVIVEQVQWPWHTCCLRWNVILGIYQIQGEWSVESISAIWFPRTEPGDRWCLCAARWTEAKKQTWLQMSFLRQHLKRRSSTSPYPLAKLYCGPIMLVPVETYKSDYGSIMTTTMKGDCYQHTIGRFLTHE